LTLKTILNKYPILDKILPSITGLVLPFARRKKKNKGSRVVAIISMHRLGDTVFTIPAVKAVFSYYSGYKIYILTFKGTGEIYRSFFPPDSIIAISRELINYNRIASNKARRILKDLKPEIIFDINTTITGVSFLINSRADKIIGASEVYYKKLYDKHITPRTKPHLTDMYLDIIEQEIPVEQFRNFIFDKDDHPGSDRILIHPFAGWKAKEWNLIKFLELTKILIQKGYNVSLIFEKGKLNGNQLKEINVPFIETDSITSLLNEIQNSFLFISNDSGPLNIAASRGKATFSIFGPINPDFSLLPGENHAFIKNELPCMPQSGHYCIKNGGFTCPSYECMNTLPLNKVSEKVLEFIRESKTNQKIKT
jgi:ADP-heptose:LPS heptosyltransferase